MIVQKARLPEGGTCLRIDGALYQAVLQFELGYFDGVGEEC